MLVSAVVSTPPNAAELTTACDTLNVAWDDIAPNGSAEKITLDNFWRADPKTEALANAALEVFIAKLPYQVLDNINTVCRGYDKAAFATLRDIDKTGVTSILDAQRALDEIAMMANLASDAVRDRFVDALQNAKAKQDELVAANAAIDNINRIDGNQAVFNAAVDNPTQNACLGVMNLFISNNVAYQDMKTITNLFSQYKDKNDILLLNCKSKSDGTPIVQNLSHIIYSASKQARDNFIGIIERDKRQLDIFEPLINQIQDLEDRLLEANGKGPITDFPAALTQAQALIAKFNAESTPNIADIRSKGLRDKAILMRDMLTVFVPACDANIAKNEVERLGHLITQNRDEAVAAQDSAEVAQAEAQRNGQIVDASKYLFDTHKNHTDSIITDHPTDTQAIHNAITTLVSAEAAVKNAANKAESELTKAQKAVENAEAAVTKAEANYVLAEAAALRADSAVSAANANRAARAVSAANANRAAHRVARAACDVARDARDAARDARDAARDARNDAVTARDAAVTARNAAVTARNAAATSRTQAETTTKTIRDNNTYKEPSPKVVFVNSSYQPSYGSVYSRRDDYSGYTSSSRVGRAPRRFSSLDRSRLLSRYKSRTRRRRPVRRRRQKTSYTER